MKNISEYLRKIIKDNCAETKVKFVGHIANPAEIMKEIDILFHPTGLESFGRIFTEAMAGGIPVVAVRQGGALELIQHGVNGYLVGDNDEEQAALQIMKLKDSNIRGLFGKNGRAIVEKDYTLESTANKIADLYRQHLPA